MQKVLAALRDVRLLADLPLVALERLARGAKVEQVAFGRTLFEEGDPARWVCFVRSGCVRLTVDCAERPQTLQLLGVGAIVGEEETVGVARRVTSARAAAKPTVLLKVRGDVLAEIARQQPTLDAALRQVAAERKLEAFLVRKTEFARSLSPAERRILIAGCSEWRISDGEPPLEDEPSLLIVGEGELAVTQLSTGVELKVGRVIPGDTFGEWRLLGKKQPARLRFTAKGDMLIYAVPRGKLRELRRSRVLIDYLRARTERWRRLGEPLSGSIDAFLGDFTQLATPEADEPEDAEPVPTPGSFPFVAQQGEGRREGAVACLAMCLRALDRSGDPARISAALAGLDDSAGLAEVAVGAEALGLFARDVVVGWDRLGTVDLPALILWHGRFRVIHEVRGDRVLLADPVDGLLVRDVGTLLEGWDGRVLLLDVAPPSRAQADESPWRGLLRHVTPYKGLIARAATIALCMHVLSLASPRFVEWISDLVVVHADLGLLDLLLAGMLVIKLATLTLGALRTFVVAHVGRRVGFAMQRAFFHRLLGLRMSFLRGKDTGDLLKRFGDLLELRSLVLGELLGVVLDLLLVVIYGAQMIAYSGSLSLWSLAFFAPFALVVLIQAPVLSRFNRLLFDADATQRNQAIEAIDGIETVKALGLEGHTFTRWRSAFHKTLNVGYRLTIFSTGMSFVTSCLSWAGSVFVLGYGAHLVIDGQLSVGQLMAFQVMFSGLLEPIVRLVGLYARVAEGKVVLERVQEVLEAEAEEEPDARPRYQPPQIQGALRFENVSFRYSDEGPWILRNVSFECHVGESVALVGRSGGGKTTALRLVQRLERPTEGRISLDGVDLAHYPLDVLRRAVGVIPQEPTLFDMTIAQNITLGGGPPDAARLAKAARMADVHEFTAKLPLGYQTIVGERGRNLSGGQRQRVALARALYRSPQVVLLDEATSALDTLSERKVQDHLDGYLKERTALVVAHRLATVRTANTIVVLDGGQVVESGDHASLLANRGLYYHLVSEQVGV